jgi:uncharacterized protein
MNTYRLVLSLLCIGVLCITGSCNGQHRASDTAGNPENYARTIDSIRQAKDAAFLTPEQSPLDGLETIASFEGLPYYPLDSTYRLTARVQHTPDAEPFAMEMTRERETRYVQHGTLHFTLKGQALTLNAFRNLDFEGDPYLFVPFRDATSGSETYGGGRYLDIRTPLDATEIELDFNLAYHPYCVYNYKYSCPIPPPENTLPLAIEAGERLPEEP